MIEMETEMFESEEYERFLTLDGLTAMAGVPRNKIAKLAVKELVDNAFDATGWCDVGSLGENGFYVQDNGPGIDTTQVADLFSVKRPLKSTKYLRLPSRGALGNGLRVVSGAVFATGGTLMVCTEGKILNLVPQHDGSTSVQAVGDYEGIGTRVEVTLGSAAGKIDFEWAVWTIRFSGGDYYRGKTSAWWYSPEDFFALCQAAKKQTISDLVSMFDGCSTTIGAITSGYKGCKATAITQNDANILLDRMRGASRPVDPKKLGTCHGKFLEKELGSYARIFDIFRDSIPYVVEAWAKVDGVDKAEIHVIVNRTPITGEVSASHSKTQLLISGCNLVQEGYVLPIEVGRRPAKVAVSIITPYMPITSSGKSPDLFYFRGGIKAAIEKAVNKAKRNGHKEFKISHKAIVLNHLLAAIDNVSVHGQHKYNQRMLFYNVREIVSKAGAGALSYDNFTSIIDNYENSIGSDLPGMVRDDRGSIYTPHIGEDPESLGSEMARIYKPPAWTYNKVLFIEKEGFFHILRDEKWPEKHDCALLTSKGQGTRAAKDLIDQLADCEEDITVFCLHDGDAAGSMIFQALQGETVARGERKVEIINLGLEPWEGVQLGIMPEPVKYEKKQPVAQYIIDRSAQIDETDWEDWLQHFRIELNALNTPRFLTWLDSKMEQYGKVIPPDSVIEGELEERVRENLSREITDKILREHNAEDQIEQEFEKIKPTLKEQAKKLHDKMEKELKQEPTNSWRDPVRRVAFGLAVSTTPEHSDS